ncbi:MAG: thiamine phosphate synthase [Terriglobales bacterium]
MQPLYPILDAEAASAHGHDLLACARGFTALGLDVQQLRAKTVSTPAFLALAEQLQSVVPRLIINDRADLALLAHAAGVHAGQDDLPLSSLRTLNPNWMLGASTHSLDQAQAALGAHPDYLAIGPVYRTQTKLNPDPEVGLDRVAAVRALTRLPLVAIGGIRLDNCIPVWRAGADAVAVISGLWAVRNPISAARQFLLAFQRV